MKTLFVFLLTFCYLFITPTWAQDPLNDSSLVAYWSFDSIIDNTIYDESYYRNHGTNYGAQIVEGKLGNALAFDGIDDYVRIPDNNIPPDPIFSTLGVGSIALWFKVNYIPTEFGIAPIFYYGAEDSCVNMFDAANEGLIIEVGHSPVHHGSKRLYFTIWADGCWLPSFSPP